MKPETKYILRHLRKALSAFVMTAFLSNTILTPPFGSLREAYAQSAFVLPVPGEMVHLSAAYTPPLLKAVKVNLDNPFAFNFIVDIGSGELSDDSLQKESNKLIRYFLASLTTPDFGTPSGTHAPKLMESLRLDSKIFM